MDRTRNDHYSIFRFCYGTCFKFCGICFFPSVFPFLRRLICFCLFCFLFLLISTILSEIRGLKLLKKCWYFIIPRRCLTEYIREICASNWKTHAQGVRTTCSKREKQSSGKGRASSVNNYWLCLSRLTCEEIYDFLRLLIVAVFK